MTLIDLFMVKPFTSGELAFYTTLINLGGPLVFKFVSDNLYGPCLRTVRGARTDSAYFRLDCGDVAFASCAQPTAFISIRTPIGERLTRHGLCRPYGATARRMPSS